MITHLYDKMDGLANDIKFLPSSMRRRQHWPERPGYPSASSPSFNDGDLVKA